MGSAGVFRLRRRRRRKRIARPTSSAPRATPTPMPALADPLNPGEAEFGVAMDEEEGDCCDNEDSGRDEEEAEAEADAVEVEDVDTVAPEDEVVLDGRLYPASE